MGDRERKTPPKLLYTLNLLVPGGHDETYAVWLVYSKDKA